MGLYFYESLHYVGREDKKELPEKCSCGANRETFFKNWFGTIECTCGMKYYNYREYKIILLK